MIAFIFAIHGLSAGPLWMCCDCHWTVPPFALWGCNRRCSGCVTPRRANRCNRHPRHYPAFCSSPPNLNMTIVDVAGKTALVTGGTRGLGLHVAESFVLNDASVVIVTSRKADACAAAQLELESIAKKNGKSCKIIAMACDISKDAELKEFVRKVGEQVDRLDILIANAGATYGEKFDTHPIEAVRKVLELNITGVFHTIQLCTPLLQKAGTKEDPARVVIVSSVASFVATDFGGTYGYLASKAGVAHLGKNLALTLASRNINVNIIAPGFFETKMTKGMMKTKGSEMVLGNPLNRMGTKQDIQSAVLWLCAKQSNYINGIVLPIDGGLYLVGTPNL